MKRTAIIAAMTMTLAGSAWAQSQQASEGAPAPAGAKAYFISPKDGDTVTSPFLAQFGLKGMGIAPAGVEFENTGHHHVLVDREAVNASSPMMKEYMQLELPDLLHFGKGQSEAMITLPPGKHTLQMVLGDTDHHPHNPPVFSDRITITVK
ncbi:MAG: DUF4399 domain-containing protein [Rhodospirillaceae bacterium]|nr:DUF4399 domain-containing protein [Rhodospirillaceae bacterium]